MSDFKRVAFVWGGFAEHKPAPVQVVPSLGIMGMAGDRAIEAYSVRATRERARRLLERQGTWDG